MILYNKQIFERCFCYKRRYWYRNLKNIPLYFKLIHYLIKHGYDKYATWGTFDWFVTTMKSVLTTYRNNRMGTPVIVDNYPFEVTTDEDRAVCYMNAAKWDDIIDKMIELLDDMDECNPKYDSMEINEADAVMNSAKDEFFELFSEYFYSLWD